MYLSHVEPISAEPVSVLYESACQNYLLLLLQTNYVPAWAGLEPVHVSLDLVVYPSRKFKAGKSYEILNTCYPTYVKQDLMYGRCFIFSFICLFA